MKYTLILTSMLLFSICAFSQKAPAAIMVDSSTIKNYIVGVEISGGKLKALPGYKFVLSKENKSIARIIRNSDGIETGQIKCECEGVEGSTCGSILEGGRLKCYSLFDCRINCIQKSSFGGLPVQIIIH